MKRRKLLQHLEKHGCVFIRGGGDHTKVGNPAKNLRSVVPRHREIPTSLAIDICKQLGVPAPNFR